MIVPWVYGFLSYHRVPITWMIVLLNVLIYVVLQSAPNEPRINVNSLEAESTLQLSGHLYEQFLQKENAQKVSAQNKKNERYYSLLGVKSFQDEQFLKTASDSQFQGDQIAIGEWKKEISAHLEKMDQKKSQIFGLRPQNSGELTWITYQFVHSGMPHLVGNMILVLLFGGAVELLVGSFAYLLIYLSSGIVGGLFYLFFSQNTWIGVIGASGSLNGLIAFYIIYETRKNIPYFYLIGRYGWIHLSKWLLVPLLVLSDFTSVLTSTEGFGGTVAHTAHIGGAVVGVVTALVLKTGRVFRRRSKATA